MKPVEKALWYVENHYREQITLEVLASVAGVSRYHLSRIFDFAVGQPFARYLRGRRLSKAAMALAAGEADILDLALSLGYGSHEAFSRAFKAAFCLTPEQVRAQGHTENLNLTEAKLMQPSRTVSLAEPRFEEAGKLAITGLSRHYGFEEVAEIPDQWQSLGLLISRLTAEVQPTTYGVIYNGSDDSFDYLTGVEISKAETAPENVVRLDIAPQRYAVFEHPGHVAHVRETCDAIWSDWLPSSDLTVVEAPWFERYGKAFDPLTGAGGLEIWIPITSGN